MTRNFVKLNDGKTEFIVVGSKQQRSKVNITEVRVGDTMINPSDSARNLGIIFDENLSMDKYITAFHQSSLMDNYVEDKLADWGMQHMIETFRDVLYEVDFLVKAVDICFKVFFIFNAEYPAEAADVTTRTQVRHYSSVIMPRAKPTKKRKFYGNKYTRPLKETAKPCASEEKLQYTKKRSVVAELDGYRLIDVRNLVNFVSAFPCPNCGDHGYTVTEDIAGLRSSLSFECMNHDCGHTYKLNSQPDGESVNTRFEMAMFSIGRNRQQAVRLLGEMNMPPPVSCTMWNKTKDKIHEATRSVAGESMRRAAHELRDGTGCTNVTVSCDGSWQRRGFQSKNGVATVLSVNPRGPAKVVDVHVSSNYCNTCKTQASKLSEAEFNAWYENHKGRCQKNHDGSAGAMEPDGMLKIFRRSEEKHGLVYTGYLGDGDSKSYHTVASADPPIYPENDAKNRISLY
ncbi:hypothetical protein LSAT2_015918 [Lamellibrachia satsuma]|nr:hypothetical protein LSAT2_015918 [Lamellibrachia satsuma]